MPKFKITVFELDFLTEEKTGKVLFETIIEAKNKARSVSNALKLIHDNGIYEQYRHLCFTESDEVE